MLYISVYNTCTHVLNNAKYDHAKSEDLSRSLEINAIWIFNMEFSTISNKSCTYVIFYPRLFITK